MSTHHAVRKTLFLSSQFQKQQLCESMSLDIHYVHNALNRTGFYAFLENNYYYYY